MATAKTLLSQRKQIPYNIKKRGKNSKDRIRDKLRGVKLAIYEIADNGDITVRDFSSRFILLKKHIYRFFIMKKISNQVSDEKNCNFLQKFSIAILNWAYRQIQPTFFSRFFLKSGRVFIRSKERSIRGSPQSGTAALWGDVAAASSDLFNINTRTAANYEKIVKMHFSRSLIKFNYIVKEYWEQIPELILDIVNMRVESLID